VLLQGAGERPDWRYFSLDRVNGREEERHGGFRAAEAARRQDRFDAMHELLLRARHERELDLDDRAVLRELAAEAGLDVARFEQDLDDPRLLDRLERDHAEAVAEHGAFGTPTFVFPGGGSAYVRLGPAPAAGDAARAFSALSRLIADESYLLEVKRPAKPERQ